MVNICSEDPPGPLDRRFPCAGPAPGGVSGKSTRARESRGDPGAAQLRTRAFWFSTRLGGFNGRQTGKTQFVCGGCGVAEKKRACINMLCDCLSIYFVQICLQYNHVFIHVFFFGGGLLFVGDWVPLLPNVLLVALFASWLQNSVSRQELTGSA